MFRVDFLGGFSKKKIEKIFFENSSEGDFFKGRVLVLLGKFLRFFFGGIESSCDEYHQNLIHML